MADYRIGHGKPPKASRFRPGVSGNLKGRPKREPTPLAEIIRRVMNTPVGRQGKRGGKAITYRDMAVKALIDHALKADLGAAELILKFRADAKRYGDAGVDWLEVSDWLPDFPGQTADQKNQEFAGPRHADPTGWWEESKAKNSVSKKTRPNRRR